MNTDEPELGLFTAQRRVLAIQVKVHQWARDDPHRRFCDLFNLVADPAFLLVAWDWVVQASLKLMLEPIWETDCYPCSYGFRPGRRAHDAVAEVRQLTSKSYEWIVEGDIKACFDEIPHAALMGRVRCASGINASWHPRRGPRAAGQLWGSRPRPPVLT